MTQGSLCMRSKYQKFFLKALTLNGFKKELFSWLCFTIFPGKTRVAFHEGFVLMFMVSDKLKITLKYLRKTICPTHSKIYLTKSNLHFARVGYTENPLKEVLFFIILKSFSIC